MRCNVCQTENDEYARFCTQCGHELGQPASDASAPPPVAPSGGADPLWAQTVGTDPGGPRWTEPIPIDELPPQEVASANSDPQPTLTVPTQSPTMLTIAGAAVARPADFATVQAELRMTVAAELAVRRRRRKALLMSLGAIVVLIGAVVAIVFATTGDNGSTATDSTGLAVETTTTVIPATTVLPVATVIPVTTPATATTVSPATTVVATTVAATTVVPTTVVPTTAVATTVVATTINPTTVPAPPTTVPVTTPETTPPTATTAAPATSVAVPGNGDLGLDRPISKPACDGQFITLIGSSVDPNGYAIQVKSILDLYPSAKYLRTELVCSSLRAKSAAGDPIYVVFFGPFVSKQQACDARRDGTDGAYVKTLDNTSNPGAGVNCSN
ncbi:MAG: zinc ribbon domain-containing protein [Ilumatobacteraceae bacterium]